MSLKVDHSVFSSRYCCGLQEMGGFNTTYVSAHVMTKEEKDQFMVSLSNRPVTHCTTVLEYKEGSGYYDEDDHYHEGYDTLEPAQDDQGTMNILLPQLGFIPVVKFKGSEGNTVQMWVYVRPDNQLE